MVVKCSKAFSTKNMPRSKFYQEMYSSQFLLRNCVVGSADGNKHLVSSHDLQPLLKLTFNNLRCAHSAVITFS
jgi:hypothetical protein